MSASEFDTELARTAAPWGDEAVGYPIDHSPARRSRTTDTARGAWSRVDLLAVPEAEVEREVLSIRVARRTADVVIALLGLIVMLPVLLVLVAAIRLDSKGPALFRQPRVGRDGTTFTMIKFRTMFADAEVRQKELERRNESIGGVLFKMRADPRVTRVGRRVRALNLDEIPQLLNVLRGDMSIVGPRPLPLRDSELLATCNPREYRMRLTVRPGITGEWQVRRSGDSDYSSMLQLDMAYLDQRSLAHDGLIAAMTVMGFVRAIVAGRRKDR